MRRSGFLKYSRMLLLAALIVVGGAGTALAQSSTSSNYKVTETQFGSGSTQQQCSASYCTKTSIGDMGNGSSSSAGGSAQFGSITPDEPLLEVIIEPGVSFLGDLSSTQTATKTTIVKVRSYLSNGYFIQVTGDPPKYGNHTLSTPSSPTASQVGSEQFGINVVANSSPNVGANPVQVPSGQYSFGEAYTGYNTANLFKYNSGDTVARSTVASGQTEYTISMIVNISNLTPSGHYSGDFSAVVVPAY
ncbi:hypothetical protein KDA14_03855 [Candidatus Saccharibacteria bacterium]|nr:hypothetical protein [Candidatus Saccharibacteria bacterium]